MSDTTTSLSKPYKTGTISIAADGTIVTGTGTLWSTQAEEGDWLWCNGVFAGITADFDDTTLNLELPWTGGEIVDQEYRLYKMSWLRYEPAETQAKVRELIAMISQQGVFLFVTGASPDPGMGEDGQWALKTNEGAWKLWYKEDGLWVPQGDPVGFAWKGLWNSSDTFGLNDIVHRFGNAWISLVAENTGHDPASEADPHDGVYWDLYVSQGDRYEIWFGDSDQPVDGEELFKGYVTLDIEFPAHLAQSIAKADVASTDACVFSIRKNNIEFATLTFGAGQSTGAFESTGMTLTAGDKISLIAPNPRDVTLRGLAATLVAYRS